MKFRPSYYAQQQLTSYAPNGGYPGFYGDGETSSEAEAKAQAEAEIKKAEEEFNLAVSACKGTKERYLGPFPLWNEDICRIAAQKVLDEAKAYAEKKLKEATEGKSPTTTTGGGTTGGGKGGGKYKAKPATDLTVLWAVLSGLAVAGAVGGVVWYARQPRRRSS